jgi:zinc transport system ATP-binding protein
MTQISCNNISLAYENNIVLTDLTFIVESGDYLCIVGENGSGKSTLVHALLGLKRVSCGKIEYGDGLRQTEIGYLPQQTKTQKDFPASVYEVVLSGCLNRRGLRPFYSSAEHESVMINLNRLDITSLKRRSYSEISRGQQQRVLLARALCATKKMLLLDEPAAGLDPVAAADLYQLITNINSSGITVIMVSHDINSAVKHASHMLHLTNKQVFFGKTDDYIQSDVGHRFLGVEDNG